MKDYLLGIDTGTTATKGILLHPSRGIVVEAECGSLGKMVLGRDWRNDCPPRK